MNHRHLPILLLASLCASGALAHGDEDHGAAKVAMPAATAWPSAEAHSEDFELFAQLQGERLTVYLDQYADNQPVENASIELTSAAFTTQLQAVSPGQYAADAAPLAHPGEHELSFTLRAGEQFDLLETRLTVRAAPPEHSTTPALSWRWAVAAAVSLLLLGLLARRYAWPKSRHPQPRGPAL
jgi:cobalt-zinc-cadmium efflux system membrane fusion protein